MATAESQYSSALRQSMRRRSFRPSRWDKTCSSSYIVSSLTDWGQTRHGTG